MPDDSEIEDEFEIDVEGINGCYGGDEPEQGS